jgi:ABC-type multidrug transport system fused ATPase/permease subunit
VNAQPPISVLPRGAGLKIAAVVLLLLVEAAFSALIPVSAGRVLDAVLPNRNRDALITIAEILVLVGLAAVLAGVGRDYVWTRLQSHAIASLRQSMFERLQQTSMGFHRRSPFNTVLEGFRPASRRLPWIFLAPSGMSRRADRAAAVSQEQERGVLSLVQESLAGAAADPRFFPGADGRGRVSSSQ